MKRTTHGHVARSKQKKKKLTIELPPLSPAGEAEQASGSEDLRTERQTRKTGPREWTPEEDNCLKSQISDKTKWNWKSVCRLLNKTFGGKRRTCKDCQQRWAVLTQPHSKACWSPNEELILLCHLHAHSRLADIPSNALEKRTAADLREHVSEQLRAIAGIVKAQRLTDYTTANALQQLQLQVYLALLLRSWEPNPPSSPPPPPPPPAPTSTPATAPRVEAEVSEAIVTQGLTEEECLSYLRTLGLGTKAQLQRRLDDSLAVLESKVLASDLNGTAADDGLREVLHTRVEAPPAPIPQFVEIVAFNGSNNDYILVGYLSPYPPISF